MNVLVINLTRFGDLLQSQPVFHSLKAQGHKVGLVCLSNFASTVELLNDVDYILPLSGGNILASLDEDWQKSLVLVYELLSTLQKDFPADMVINFSATVSSRLLANFLGKGKCEFHGFCLDAYGFGYCSNSWTAYLLGSTINRINCSFNMVDMFYKSAKCDKVKIINSLRQPSVALLEEVRNKIKHEFKHDCPFCSPESEHSSKNPEDNKHYNILAIDSLAKQDELLENKVFKIEGCNGFIAFQLGASDEHRQWPVEYFVQLGNSLWSEFKICPILLGTGTEKHIGQEYAKYARHNFIDFIGTTTIPQLAALVSSCRLLITNDTGTMHLAAGLGIPILAFFLATAQAWDTSPYLENACCLEPAVDCHPCSFKHKCQHNYACTKDIDPEMVIMIVSHYLKFNKWEYPLNTSNYKAQIRMWTTFKDEYGFMDLKCLSGHEVEDRTLWIRIQRHFIIYMLDSLDGKIDQNSQIIWPDKYLMDNMSAKLHGDIYKILCSIDDLLFLLMQYIQLVKSKPQLNMGEKIISTYNKIQIVFSQMPHFASLQYFWMVTLNEHSENLDSIFQTAGLIKKHFCALRQFWEKPTS